MLRPGLQTQVAVHHAYGQMQVPVHGFIGQGSIQLQAGYIDLIIDGTCQIHGQVALHGRGKGINAFSLRVYLACQLDMGAVFEERGQIHLPDVHHHVIYLVINIIESFQGCRVALIIGLS